MILDEELGQFYDYRHNYFKWICCSIEKFHFTNVAIHFSGLCLEADDTQQRPQDLKGPKLALRLFELFRGLDEAEVVGGCVPKESTSDVVALMLGNFPSIKLIAMCDTLSRW